MHHLSSTEISFISGGMVCFDAFMIQNIHDKAFKDGIIFSSLTVPLTMALTLGLSNQLGAAALTGFFIAPYALAWGYCHSSIWNTIKS